MVSEKRCIVSGIFPSCIVCKDVVSSRKMLMFPRYEPNISLWLKSLCNSVVGAAYIVRQRISNTQDVPFICSSHFSAFYIRARLDGNRLPMDLTLKFWTSLNQLEQIVVREADERLKGKNEDGSGLPSIEVFAAEIQSSATASQDSHQSTELFINIEHSTNGVFEASERNEIPQVSNSTMNAILVELAMQNVYAEKRVHNIGKRNGKRKVGMKRVCHSPKKMNKRMVDAETKRNLIVSRQEENSHVEPTTDNNNNMAQMAGIVIKSSDPSLSIVVRDEQLHVEAQQEIARWHQLRDAGRLKTRIIGWKVNEMTDEQRMRGPVSQQTISPQLSQIIHDRFMHHLNQFTNKLYSSMVDVTLNDLFSL